MQMSDIGLCDESAFETADHKPCRNSLFHGHAFVGEDQFNCRHKEIVEMDLLMENLGISDEDDLNELLLGERENLLIKKTICSSISDKKTLLFSSDTSELKDLSKCAAILCSEALQSCPSIFAEDSLEPYHDSSKCVSALKGSRAQQGKPLDQNMHVTWAANVYDPPVTSSSHTVKGHRHHLPKAKTSDHHKHKHMKAKPSKNASSAGRKHSHSHNRRSSSSILDPRMARMQALSRRSVAAASGQEPCKISLAIAASYCRSFLSE